MLFSTIGQWKVFFSMMVAGVLVGVLYGILKLLRSALSAGPLLTLVADLAFGAGAALILGAMLTFSNYGAARAFAFLGATVGLCLYFAGIHSVARAVCIRLSRGIRHIFSAIAKNRLIKVIFK